MLTHDRNGLEDFNGQHGLASCHKSARLDETRLHASYGICRRKLISPFSRFVTIQSPLGHAAAAARILPSAHLSHTATISAHRRIPRSTGGRRRSSTNGHSWPFFLLFFQIRSALSLLPLEAAVTARAPPSLPPPLQIRHGSVSRASTASHDRFPFFSWLPSVSGQAARRETDMAARAPPAKDPPASRPPPRHAHLAGDLQQVPSSTRATIRPPPRSSAA